MGLIEDLKCCQRKEIAQYLDSDLIGVNSWEALAVYAKIEQRYILEYRTAFRRGSTPTQCVIDNLISRRWKIECLLNGLMTIRREDVAYHVEAHLSSGCDLCR